MCNFFHHYNKQNLRKLTVKKERIILDHVIRSSTHDQEAQLL